MSDIEYKPTGLIDKAALEHFKSKKIIAGFSHYDVWLEQHALAFSVAKMMDADLLAETKAAIESAQQNGTSFNDFKKRLKPFLMSKGWWGEQIMIDPKDGKPKLVQLGSTRRLRTIFNTNMQTAFAAGQWQRIQANKKALPYLRYNHSAAGHPRDSHKRYYGMILPVEHDIWKVVFPPNGYGCKCSVSQLTRKQAEREGISGEPDVEMVEFTNPRTGQTVQIPSDITPSFAHNHGDRLGAIQNLMRDKHGIEFAQKIETMLDEYLMKRINLSDMKLVDFSDITFNQNEVDRLVFDENGSGKPAIMEAKVGDKWQQYFGVKLERPPAHKKESGVLTPKGIDFLIVNPDNPDKTTWKKMDWLYAFEAHVNIKEMIRTITKSSIAWGKHTKTIIDHLEKADIVPMYLPMLDIQTRTKIISFVLSLPAKQQQQIVFVWDKLG